MIDLPLLAVWLLCITAFALTVASAMLMFVLIWFVVNVIRGNL